MLRVAPFVGLLYTALVVWFLEGASRSQLAMPPLRPWYKHKRGLCFADILRAAQRAMVGFDILDPRKDIKHLHKLARWSAPRDEPDREMAAQGRNTSLSRREPPCFPGDRALHCRESRYGMKR